ncbi:diguanylate cyclase domain-containing protein [Aeromicrobium sp. P5_D10]
MDTREAVTGADLFTASAQRIVDYLNQHTPITDWSVSRVAGGEQVHVHVHPGELLHVGARVPWPRTFCNRMMLGAARVVADSQQDPDYSDLPDALEVRSYAGSPISDDDGTTFGVLCGVGRKPLSGIDAIDADLVQLMGDLLSSQLAMARAADRDRRNVEITDALAHTDALTGLVNRRGWDLLVGDAQKRVDSYGDLVAVAMIDLDGLKTVNDSWGHQAGDELLRRAGAALSAVEEPVDRIARYGGDEFAILSNNVAVADLAEHFGRFVDSLAASGVQASLGFASTGPGDTNLVKAFAQADARMYERKHARKRV